MKVAIVTVSDRSYRGEREDKSGPALARATEEAGFEVVARELVPDEKDMIADILKKLADAPDLDVILTIGGTGVASRDVTPEATLEVIDRRIPGMAEAMRMKSLEVTPNAMLSRAETGLRRKVIIVNLPGSPKGAVECFQIIAPALCHAVDMIQGKPHSHHD